MWGMTAGCPGWGRVPSLGPGRGWVSLIRVLTEEGEGQA